MLSFYVFVLVLFEAGLVLSCNRWYYPRGVVVLRIAVHFSNDEAFLEGRRFVLNPLSEEIKLVALGDGKYALREKYTFYLMPYLPLMRGMLLLDATRQSLEVRGLLNATVLMLVLTCFVWATYNVVAPVLFLAWAGVSYVIQRDRLRYVATQAATGVKGLTTR